jgi:hypothetical protein
MQALAIGLERQLHERFTARGCRADHGDRRRNRDRGQTVGADL